MASNDSLRNKRGQKMTESVSGSSGSCDAESSGVVCRKRVFTKLSPLPVALKQLDGYEAASNAKRFKNMERSSFLNFIKTEYPASSHSRHTKTIMGRWTSMSLLERLAYLPQDQKSVDENLEPASKRVRARPKRLSPSPPCAREGFGSAIAQNPKTNIVHLNVAPDVGKAAPLSSDSKSARFLAGSGAFASETLEDPKPKKVLNDRSKIMTGHRISARIKSAALKLKQEKFVKKVPTLDLPPVKSSNNSSVQKEKPANFIRGLAGAATCKYVAKALGIADPYAPLSAATIFKIENPPQLSNPRFVPGTGVRNAPAAVPKIFSVPGLGSDVENTTNHSLNDEWKGYSEVQKSIKKQLEQHKRGFDVDQYYRALSQPPDVIPPGGKWPFAYRSYEDRDSVVIEWDYDNWLACKGPL